MIYQKTCSLKELHNFSKKIIEQLGDFGVILLKGDLASGKTTFVKEFVKSLGIKEEVSSPTFSILNEYEDRVYHYDIYQNGMDGFLQSGLLEKLEEKKYHLIEWSDESLEDLLKLLEIKFIAIKISTEKNKRIYTVRT